MGNQLDDFGTTSETRQLLRELRPDRQKLAIRKESSPREAEGRGLSAGEIQEQRPRADSKERRNLKRPDRGSEPIPFQVGLRSQPLPGTAQR